MKKFLLLIIVPALLVFLLIIVLLPADVEIYTNADGVSGAVGSLQPRAMELDGLTIKAQPDSTTCGITTVAVISNYYNDTDFEANDLMAKHGSKGTTDMAELLEKELPGKTIAFKSNVTNEEMIRDIHASLKSNDPVAVYFGAPNPFNEPYYDSHGSVVCGIDLENESITIGNSYGYREVISLVDFLNRMSYAERDRYTPAQRFVWKFTRVNKNQYFLIEDA